MDSAALLETPQAPPKKESHKRNPRQIFLACLVVLIVVVGEMFRRHPDLYRKQSVVIIASFWPSSPDSSYDACDIFCHGPVLETMQNAYLFNDSKSFVDIPLIKSPDDVMNDFNALPDHSNATLQKFLAQDFSSGGPGADVIQWIPDDYVESPDFLQNIASAEYRAWAQQVNALWEQLGKQVTQDVYDNPEWHTILPLLHPQMVVPGGRFREFYYWDSYWIVRGLLVCQMQKTAQTIVENLLDLVSKYGMVPNGSRRYYLTRSQPPFLTLMVNAIFEATGDTNFLQKALPILDQEYQFWMRQGEHALSVVDTQGITHTVNRYYSNTGLPRPESFREDEATASKVAPDQQATLYNQLAAGAESGWDFSSRWFADGENISSIVTMDIIPVDLNAIMCKVEKTLSTLWSKSSSDKATYYSKAAQQRALALQNLLFNSNAQSWQDYNWRTKKYNTAQSVSNWIPLWTDCFDTSKAGGIITALNTSGLILPGGIATTLANTGQQWDFPNAWPPLQHMIIEGLDQINSTESNSLAFYLAEIWVNSNYLAFNRTQVMFEKYLATTPGGTGGGGEYTLQTGFGWTNGVILSLLQRYGGQLGPLQ